MQANTNAGSFVDVFRRSVDEGFFSLWRGLAPTLWRDIPFSGLYWMSFETLKEKLTQHFRHESNHRQRWSDAQAQLGIAFIAGAASGTMATIMTQPFDVVKTKQQMQYFSTTNDAMLANLSVSHMLREILRHEGMST